MLRQARECLIALPAFDHLPQPVLRPLPAVRDASRRVRDRAIHWGLSPREAQVFDLVARGRQNKEVASILEVSVKTVEKHLANVMQKASVHSRTELLSALLQG